MSSLGVNPDIDLQELLQVAASDDFSVQFSPMLRGPGGEQGGTIIRQAVQWKGLKKGDNESFSEYKQRLAAVNQDVADGLSTARSMAMETEGSKGIAIVESDGQKYPVSAGAAQLMETAGNGRVIKEGLESVNAAIDELASMGEPRPRRPAVY